MSTAALAALQHRLWAAVGAEEWSVVRLASRGVVEAERPAQHGWHPGAREQTLMMVYVTARDRLREAGLWEEPRYEALTEWGGGDAEHLAGMATTAAVVRDLRRGQLSRDEVIAAAVGALVELRRRGVPARSVLLWSEGWGVLEPGLWVSIAAGMPREWALRAQAEIEERRLAAAEVP